jgi:hypothetical protein
MHHITRRLSPSLIVMIAGALAVCVAPAAHAGVALNTIDDHATYARSGAKVRASGPIGTETRRWCKRVALSARF